MAVLLPPFARLLQFAVAFGKDQGVPSVEFVLRRDVADGAVQADGVVVLDVAGDDPLGVLQGQGCLRPDAIALDGAMPAFDLAIALGVVGRSPHVRHAADPDEFLEVLGDELRTVVGDDPRRDAGEFLPCPLDDLLDVGLGVMASRISQWTVKRLQPSSRLHR